MKKLIAIMLVLALVVGLTACTENGNIPQSEPETAKATTLETTESLTTTPAESQLDTYAGINFRTLFGTNSAYIRNVLGEPIETYIDEYNGSTVYHFDNGLRLRILNDTVWDMVVCYRNVAELSQYHFNGIDGTFTNDSVQQLMGKPDMTRTDDHMPERVALMYAYTNYRGEADLILSFNSYFTLIEIMYTETPLIWYS